jgi:hypothetical protein
MRTAQTFVVVETIALVVLALLWASADPSAPPGPGAPAPDRGSDAGAAAAARRTRLAADGEPAPVAGEPARRAEAAAPAAAVTDVVVRGRLVTADGSPLPENLYVGFRRRSTYRGATQVGDRYAAVGLSPGPWTVTVRADRFARVEEELELGAAAVQDHDIELRPAHAIDVLLRTPDDQPLAAALGDRAQLRGLRVIATATALATDLPETENVSVGDIGLGRYEADSFGSPKEGEPDARLWVDGPDATNAALLLRHLVIAQQPIAVGQRELRFVVDPTALTARLGAVSLRLIDGATGAPLSGVSVRLSSAQGGGAGGKTDADGRVRIDDVVPGLQSMQLHGGQGREALWDLVRVPAGGTAELGDVALHPAAPIRGTAVDADGAPVAGASVQWTRLSTMRFPRELVDRRSASADGDGAFDLWGTGPHRYVLVAHDTFNRRVGHAVVDAATATAVELRLATAGRVTIRIPGDGLQGFVATLRTEDGVPVAARSIEPRFPQQSLMAAPGRYTLEVHGAGDRLVRREPVTLAAGEDVLVEVAR